MRSGADHRIRNRTRFTTLRMGLDGKVVASGFHLFDLRQVAKSCCGAVAPRIISRPPAPCEHSPKAENPRGYREPPTGSRRLVNARKRNLCFYPPNLLTGARNPFIASWPVVATNSGNAEGAKGP